MYARLQRTNCHCTPSPIPLIVQRVTRPQPYTARMQRIATRHMRIWLRQPAAGPRTLARSAAATWATSSCRQATPDRENCRLYSRLPTPHLHPESSNTNRRDILPAGLSRQGGGDSQGKPSLEHAKSKHGGLLEQSLVKSGFQRLGYTLTPAPMTAWPPPPPPAAPHGPELALESVVGFSGS